MKITESKLREMIRGVIKEISSGATALGGAKKKGYESTDTKSKKSTYDEKTSRYQTKQSDYESKKADRESADSQKYRKAAKGGGWQYSASNRPGFSVNPDWTTKSNLETSAESSRDSAEAAKDSAESDWNAAKESDFKRTIPKKERQTGGGKGGFGKGKAAGKGKGKGKGDDE